MPESAFKSSVLRCFEADPDCAVCRFLEGSRGDEDLIAVINVLDKTLADQEHHNRVLTSTLVSTRILNAKWESNN